MAIHNLRPVLIASVAFTALLPVAPIAAQTTSAVANEAEEIIVSARRRDERLIDVPVAVSAYSQVDLERLQAIDLAGIQGTAPNLNIVQGRGSATSANIFIRGIGQPDALQTFDPAVGVYVDGVYLSRIQGALLSLGDVERIEVLRGPQGTLYGKNTIGGAISIISRKPNLNTLSANVSALYGSYNQILLNGYVSAPLVADKLALSVAAQWDKRDGLVTDPRTDRRYNDRDSLTGRAILRAQPSDRVEVIVSGDYTRQRNALTLGYPTAPLGGVRPIPANPYGEYDYQASTSFTGDEGQRLDHWGLSLTANFELSDTLTLSSITAYRKLRPDLFIDIDASQAELGDVFVGINQEQFSQELQLKWNSDRLSGVFGLYYLDETISSHQEAYADDLLGLPFTRLIDDRQQTRSYAAFGQATYDLTDKFAVTAGLRYTREDRDYTRLTTVATIPAFQGFFPPFSFPSSLPAPFNDDGRATFDAWTPTITLSYKPTPDTLVYANASRGFKSGGFNGRANGVADLTQIVDGVPQIVTQFRPETVWTYETGAKGSFMDGRVRLSANAFYSDYNDFQARVGGGALGVFPVLNAGKLRIWGLEGEAAVRPTDRWNIRVSAGYLNAEYKEFNDGRRPPTFSCNPTGNAITCEPAFAPPLTLTLGSDYTIPMGNVGSLTFGGDGRFVDAHFLSVDNRQNLREPGYWVANAYIQFDATAGWYLRGGVKNLTDSLYRTDGQEFSAVGNIQTVYFGDPRTFNATVGFRF
jgi:iron complex outermembrane receptor protein